MSRITKKKWLVLAVIIIVLGVSLIYWYIQNLPRAEPYGPRIPQPFSTLGIPDDWNIASSGNFDVVLNNRLANNIEIYKVTAIWDSTRIVYEPKQPILIEAVGEKTLLSSESGLNFGPREEGIRYSINVELLYNSGNYNHTETGKLTGTVG